MGVCRVHFLRNVFAQVPKGSQEMVAAAVRAIFAQPDADHVREQLDVIATMLGRQSTWRCQSSLASPSLVPSARVIGLEWL